MKNLYALLSFFGPTSLLLGATAASRLRRGGRAIVNDKGDVNHHARRMLNGIDDMGLFIKDSLPVPHNKAYMNEMDQATGGTQTCENLDLYALTVEYNNPQVYVNDGGNTTYFYNVYNATSGATAGLYGDRPWITGTLTDGTCVVGGIFVLTAEDTIWVAGTCDGSGFDIYDQYIYGGSGKYECADGIVIKTEVESRVTFEIIACMDPANCE